MSEEVANDPYESHETYHDTDDLGEVSFYELSLFKPLSEISAFGYGQWNLRVTDFSSPYLESSACVLRLDEVEAIAQVTYLFENRYWKHHRYSSSAFAAAFTQAVSRLKQEGHPVTNPAMHEHEEGFVVHWTLRLPININPDFLVEAIEAAFDLIWKRADSMLEGSDSVLIIGKDSDVLSLEKLERIASVLERLGYFTYIIKEIPDRAGESVIQKVLRYALSSKFVIVKNSEPSGHLYELPHIAKLAECITVVLQEENKGSTWMFEDAYARHRHWHKLIYKSHDLEKAVEEASSWAETFHKEFTKYQLENLPWFKL